MDTGPYELTLITAFGLRARIQDEFNWLLSPLSESLYGSSKPRTCAPRILSRVRGEPLGTLEGTKVQKKIVHW